MKKFLYLALLLATAAVDAQTKISQLPAGTTPAGGELFAAVQSGSTVSLTTAQIAAYAITQLSQGDVTSLFSEDANTVFAGPTSGGAATASFRALVSADIPGSIASNTSGNAATATALAATPSVCTAEFSLGIAANGDASCGNTLSSAVIGSPTGGNEGAGSLNAQSLFVNGAAVATTTSGCTNGSFTAELDGFSGTAPSLTMFYSLCGTSVWIYSNQAASGTSNAGLFGVTALPSAIIRGSGQSSFAWCAGLEDNGNTNLIGLGIAPVSGNELQLGLTEVNGSYVQYSSFTPSGTKGITENFVCTYTLGF